MPDSLSVVIVRRVLSARSAAPAPVRRAAPGEGVSVLRSWPHE